MGFEGEFVLLNASGEASQTIDIVSTWSTTSGLRGSTLGLETPVAWLTKARRET